jgi:hypothetical protein
VTGGHGRLGFELGGDVDDCCRLDEVAKRIDRVGGSQ